MVSLGFPAKEVVLSPEELLHRNDLTKSVSFGPREHEIKMDIPTVVDDNLKILNKIPLPENIQKPELEKRIEKIIREDLEKDPLFNMGKDLAKYANDFRNKFTLYFSKIFDYHKLCISTLDKELFFYSHLFLNSDLSPSFLKSLTLSAITEMKMVETVDQRMRHERLELVGFKDNAIKFGRVVDAHNSWVDPLVKHGDNMVDDRVALLWYVDFQNAKSIDDILKPKPIRKENLNQEVFYSLLFATQNSTQQLRKILLNYNREVFLSAVPIGNPTFELFSSMVHSVLHA